jgi:hypothetical protein
MKFLILPLLFVPFLSHAANFSGRWTGEAQMTAKDGTVYLCEGVDIMVNQQTDKATFGNFTYSCGGYSFTFIPPTLTVNGDKVYYKNKYNDYIGTLTDSEAQLLFVVNDQNSRAKYTVKKISDTEIDYLDEQIDVDPDTGKDIEMSIHAQLKKL